MADSAGLLAEQEALDTLSEAVHSAMSTADERLVLLVSMVAPTSYERLRAFTPDGRLQDGGERYNSVEVPIEATIALRELRVASYRDGVGTWFGLKLTVASDGTTRAEYNYDDEPEWDAPVDPVVYLTDLKKFPRDDGNQPEWLRQKVADANAAGMTQPDLPPAAPYAPATTNPTGRTSWMLGFLAYIPIPFLGLVIAAVAMLAANGSAKRTGQPVAMENGRRAANWGITVLLVMALCGLYVLFLAIAVPDARSAGFFPIGLSVVVILLLAVAHVVVTIAGTVIAGRGRVFRAPAIPFLRA